jgi:hypothetical protein
MSKIRSTKLKKEEEGKYSMLGTPLFFLLAITILSILETLLFFLLAITILSIVIK